MTVKQAREEMYYLEAIQKNMCALYSYFKKPGNGEMVMGIEEIAGINDTLENVLSDSITIIESKCKELNERIENAEI